jgi:hypothetical protein
MKLFLSGALLLLLLPVASAQKTSSVSLTMDGRLLAKSGKGISRK